MAAAAVAPKTMKRDAPKEEEEERSMKRKKCTECGLLAPIGSLEAAFCSACWSHVETCRKCTVIFQKCSPRVCTACRCPTCKEHAIFDCKCGASLCPFCEEDNYFECEACDYAACVDCTEADGRLTDNDLCTPCYAKAEADE